MIREERDPAFWFEIASHPAIAGALMGLDSLAVAQTALRPSILPLASENGGFFFGRMDGLGMACELHSLYRPAGWGREAASAGKEALQWVFGAYQVVITFETLANPRSRPPLSFGFVRAGDWRKTVIGQLRLWVLTKLAWETSPAHRRLTCRQ